MRETTRARIAAVVGAASQRKAVAQVFDHAAGEYRNVRVQVGAAGVAGFDHSTQSKISSEPGSALNFFDHELGHRVNLSLNGAGFSGFDFETRQHFSGTVTGPVVMIYDYQTSSYYKYSV